MKSYSRGTRGAPITGKVDTRTGTRQGTAVEKETIVTPEYGALGMTKGSLVLEDSHYAGGSARVYKQMQADKFKRIVSAKESWTGGSPTWGGRRIDKLLPEYMIYIGSRWVNMVARAGGNMMRQEAHFWLMSGGIQVECHPKYVVLLTPDHSSSVEWGNPNLESEEI